MFDHVTNECVHFRDLFQNSLMERKSNFADKPKEDIKFIQFFLNKRLLMFRVDVVARKPTITLFVDLIMHDYYKIVIFSMRKRISSVVMIKDFLISL